MEWLGQIVEPHSPLAKTGRPPFAIKTMLRIPYLQQSFGLSDTAMEEALHDVPLYREFANLGGRVIRLPNETTILRLRHLLEAYNLTVDMLRVINDIMQVRGLMLRTGTAVDAVLIGATSSIKNTQGERDPEMHQGEKGNQWYFSMKAHVGVDCASGLVYTVVGTAATVSDINVAGALLNGEEHAAFGDSGYHGVYKRAEAARPTWHVAMRPDKRKRLNPFIEPQFLAKHMEKMKASIRAKVEHTFQMIKQQFGFTKVRTTGQGSSDRFISANVRAFECCSTGVRQSVPKHIPSPMSPRSWRS